MGPVQKEWFAVKTEGLQGPKKKFRAWGQKKTLRVRKKTLGEKKLGSNDIPFFLSSTVNLDVFHDLRLWNGARH